jgi:hypothetical protein
MLCRELVSLAPAELEAQRLHRVDLGRLIVIGYTAYSTEIRVHIRSMSARPAQRVGSQVAVICDTFGDGASFPDFDLSNPGWTNQRRLTPEPKVPAIGPPRHGRTCIAMYRNTRAITGRRSFQLADQ